MDLYNSTLHKRSLARKRRILTMFGKGKTGREIAAQLKITPQRVYALAQAARNGVKK